MLATNEKQLKLLCTSLENAPGRINPDIHQIVQKNWQELEKFHK